MKPLDAVPAGREPLGQRSETVRRSNLSAILRELHARGPQTRSELVAHTGLTRSAIRGLIGEFVAADLVVEERALRPGIPGRPSPVVRPVQGAAVVLALEIKVDSLAVAVVGLGGVVLERRRMHRRRDRIGIENVLADLRGLVAGLHTLGVAGRSLIGIGVAVAGVVRRRDGWVSFAPNLEWHDVALGELIASELGLGVPILVANDAEAGALAELRRGAGRGADTMVFIGGEVGVGGGIIVDGQPLAGVSGFAGEVGHLPINPSGRECRCGSVGCWETEVGEEALLRGAGRSPEGGRASVDALLADARAGAGAAWASRSS